jgi:hypothetical protein
MPTPEQRRAYMARIRAERGARGECRSCGVPSVGYRCDECRADHKLSNPEPSPSRDRMRRLRAQRRQEQAC